MQILKDHRLELNRLAEALLEHETLNKAEIISICKGEKLEAKLPDVKIEEDPEPPSESKPREKSKGPEAAENERIIKSRGFTIYFNK